MNIQLRSFLLKSIPYLMAIAGGLVLFLVSKDNIKSPDLGDLINNIAASLLSIPLVFLLYDYSNYRIARQLNRATETTAHDKLDATLINIIGLMRQMMGMHDKFTLAALNKMGDLRVSQITDKVKINSTQIKALITLHHELDEMIYRTTNSGVLSVMQVQALTELAHNVLRLINTRRFHQGKHASARYMVDIIRFVVDWLDSDASISMRFQQLLGATQTNQQSTAQSKV